MKKKLDCIFDLTSLDGRVTGVERYALELACSICERADNRAIEFLVSKNCPSDVLDRLKFSINPLIHTIRHSAFKSKFLTQQLWIPYILMKRQGIAFFPVFPPAVGLLFNSNRLDIQHTVFDATMWLHPQTLSLKNKLYFRFLENIWINRLNVVHTISDFSREELISVFPQISDRLFNTGIGIDIARFQYRAPDFRNVLIKYNLPETFVLFVGTIEPRKNLPFLVRSFVDVVKAEPTACLVIAGRYGWGYEELLEEIERNGLQNHCRLLGAMPDNDLLALYHAASFLVYPSLYEGFGLPLVEAFASGLPVIASDVASLPYVAGGAARLCALTSETIWTTAILELWRNATIRSELRERGYLRAKDFSWAIVAEKVEAYF